MNRTWKSQRSSQEDHDSFWEIFLSPLLKKQKPEQYDPDFKKSRKPRQLLKLEQKSFNQNTCLSGIILEKLRKQNEKTDIGRKRKARRIDSELSQHIVSESQVDSQLATDKILQRQAYGSSTIEKALNSSQAASKGFRLKTEVSRHEGIVTISDDEEEVEDKKDMKDRDIDEDEDDELKWDIKQPKLEDKISQNQNEKPGQERNTSNTSKRLIDICMIADSAKQKLEQDYIDMQAILNTGSLSWASRESTKQKNLEETDEEEEEEEEMEQLDEEQEAKLKKVAGLARDRQKIDKEKSHQQVCVSGWNLPILKLYIKRDKVQLVKTLISRVISSSETFDNNRFSSLQNSLVIRSRQVLDDDQHFSLDHEKGLRLWSFQFTEPMLKEQAVSYMALEIIGSVCELCDVRLKPEETLKKNEFPNARVDFALVHKGVVFGVVEVKTPKTMNRNALIQLLLPLLKLQHLHNEERMQYLGILTDGFRFILVRLQGDKFTFESTSIEERPEIYIRTAVSWDNLSELCEYLRSVLGSVIANLLEITRISLP